MASLCLDASTSNVELTVFRRGELGNVEVAWTTTALNVAGFTPGSILPVTGTLQFPPQQNTAVLTLTVSCSSFKILSCIMLSTLHICRLVQCSHMAGQSCLK